MTLRPPGGNGERADWSTFAFARYAGAECNGRVRRGRIDTPDRAKELQIIPADGKHAGTGELDRSNAARASRLVMRSCLVPGTSAIGADRSCPGFLVVARRTRHLHRRVVVGP